MNAKYRIDENGITIKKLFKSAHINFDEIQSITEDAEHNLVTTKNGESYNIDLGFRTLTYTYPILFRYIEQYNIDFRSLDDIKDESKIYTYDEALSIARKTEEMIRRYANEFVIEQLGREFCVETRFYETAKYESGVYLILQKAGNVVRPQKNSRNWNEEDPDVFDQIELLFGPIMWDTANRCAKYGVTAECHDEEPCRKTTYECVNDFVTELRKDHTYKDSDHSAAG